MVWLSNWNLLEFCFFQALRLLMSENTDYGDDPKWIKVMSPKFQKTRFGDPGVISWRSISNFVVFCSALVVCFSEDGEFLLIQLCNDWKVE
jgi:hypothetical protein